jgi:uncharacterized protein YebE (UPF0316 family)
MIYLGIFFAKLLEVTISTVRVVLAVRGMKIVATALAGLEITIWILVASTVITQFHSDPLKGVAYVLAYTAGIFLGLVLEDKIALGLSEIQLISDCETAAEIVQDLREKGYGITEFCCTGKDGSKQMLDIKVHRKDLSATLGLLKKYANTFISVNDIRSISKGNIVRHIIK